RPGCNRRRLTGVDDARGSGSWMAVGVRCGEEGGARCGRLGQQDASPQRHTAATELRDHRSSLLAFELDFPKWAEVNDQPTRAWAVCAIGVFAASKAELRGQLGNKGPARLTPPSLSRLRMWPPRWPT